MKGFSLFNVMLIVVGIILICAGVYNMRPVDVFTNALKGKPLKKVPMGAQSSFGSGAGSANGGGGGGSSSW